MSDGVEVVCAWGAEPSGLLAPSLLAYVVPPVEAAIWLAAAALTVPLGAGPQLSRLRCSSPCTADRSRTVRRMGRRLALAAARPGVDGRLHGCRPRR